MSISELPSRHWLAVAGLSVAMFVGCFAGSQDSAQGGIDDDYMDDPPPPGGCGTACPDPGTDGSPLGGPCIDSNDCANGAICAAVFDGEVQAFSCQASCIPLLDDTQWCADDESCCAAGATCSARGFCLAASDTEGLDSGTDTGSGTGRDPTGGSDSGSGSGGSGSGGSSGSSSSSG